MHYELIFWPIRVYRIRHVFLNVSTLIVVAFLLLLLACIWRYRVITNDMNNLKHCCELVYKATLKIDKKFTMCSCNVTSYCFICRRPKVSAIGRTTLFSIQPHRVKVEGFRTRGKGSGPSLCSFCLTSPRLFSYGAILREFLCYPVSAVCHLHWVLPAAVFITAYPRFIICVHTEK